MHVTFYGAVREVTGTLHLLTTENDRILMDCGLHQGRRKDTDEKNRVLHFDPRIITNLILSHAHIDHSGRIPLLTRKRFSGRVLCTRVTVDACGYLLPDAAHIQESDANYLNYKTVRSAIHQMETSGKKKKETNAHLREIKALLKKGRRRLNADAINSLIKKHDLQSVEPLYTTDDAAEALGYFDGQPYRRPFVIGKDATCTFYEAGHILGSAISMIRVQENGRSRTVCYTGDIGRFDKPILRDPALNFAEEDRDVDLMIMESTYGDRDHEPIVDLKPRLREVLNEAEERGGAVIIPSFAYGRTQELLYVLHELYDAGEVAPLPIYVDSPLATNITRVFGEHPEVYDKEAHETFLQKGKNPFSFGKIHFVKSVEESMALNRDPSPHIVISASGMCEAGRVLHHLRHKIHDPKTTILIVGYMARNTLGRRILEQGLEYEKSGRKGEPPMLKFLNKLYPLKAHVVKIGGFSAHADRNEMLTFLKKSNLRIKRIAVVHGEEDQSTAFADLLNKEGFPAFAPRKGDAVNVR
ncbi:MAG: MBL fold metallo-hydrolase [Desulfobacterales bacterium]|nr:MBL fold metallo-hydrolase [Desulfobacterales bacterium]